MQKELSYGYFLKEDWEKRGLERGGNPQLLRTKVNYLKI